MKKQAKILALAAGLAHHVLNDDKGAFRYWVTYTGWGFLTPEELAEVYRWIDHETETAEQEKIFNKAIDKLAKHSAYAAAVLLERLVNA